MYSPKELEGEVDHAFFDSDSEPVNPSAEHPVLFELERGNGKESAELHKPEAVMRMFEEGVVMELALKQGSNVEERVKVLEKAFSRIEVQSENVEEDANKQDISKTGSEKEDSDMSSQRSSPVPCSERSESRSDSLSNSSSISSCSESSSEEEDNAVLSKGGASKDDKKRLPNSRTSRSRRPSESSSSSEEESIRSHKSNGKSPSNLKPVNTTDSDDTVTDVTPLSTPDGSPSQSFNQAPLITDGQVNIAKKNSVTNDNPKQSRSSDTDDKKGSAVSSSSRWMLIPSPGGSTNSGRSSVNQRHKNYSFSNEDVRRIERENQRLLRELSRSSARSSRLSHNSSAPTSRPYHTALNRRREQQRIEKENMAFLKRLESVKPTPGMTRSEQLADYQRQAGYLGGIPATALRPSSGRTCRSSNTTSPFRPRPATAKPSRTTAPRPAWS